MKDDIDVLLEEVLNEALEKVLNPQSVVVAANNIKNLLKTVSKPCNRVQIKDHGRVKTVVMDIDSSLENQNATQSSNYLFKNAFSRIVKMIETRTRNLPISLTINKTIEGNFLKGMTVRISPSRNFRFKVK